MIEKLTGKIQELILIESQWNLNQEHQHISSLLSYILIESQWNLNVITTTICRSTAAEY